MVMAIMPDFGGPHRRTNDSNSGAAAPPYNDAGGSGGMFPVFQQASNEAYGRMVKAIGDLQGDVVRYRAIQMLLLVACVG